MKRKPRVITKCPASHHAHPDETIVEVYWPGTRTGALISLRYGANNGKAVVEVYRNDGPVMIFSESSKEEPSS